MLRGGDADRDAQAPNREAPTGRIARRLFIHIGGFDPAPPEQVYRLFARETGRFRRVWSALTTMTEPEHRPDGADWTIETTGRNWRVSTRIRLVRWDDLMEAYAAAPWWRRIGRGVLACLDFVVGGALHRYVRTAWRYALFFLYPPLTVLAFAVAAGLGGAALSRATGSALAGALLGAAAFTALLSGPGRWFKLPLAFDDWTFASAYVRVPPKILADRLDRLAADIVAAARDGEVDEIVLLGHSLGAVLAVDAIDRALALEPDLGRTGPPVALVTVGSSVLKIALHGRAARFRAALARVAVADGPFWVEYQALSDVMNFYKTDPVGDAGLVPSGRPLVRVVRISRMLDPDYYRRIWGRFFRLHCQFVRGNDRRTAYDYFMLACGPLAVRETACLPDGPASAFATDGSLIERAPANVAAERAGSEIVLAQ
ncbi:hypothetical protein [Rhodoplanes azumiensis]|uniref:Uncharacterized protein n=1 Tax=Rhodoplanes azumiensis TaxID=1897628 RepID=A0ABW5API2_9BRAD